MKLATKVTSSWYTCKWSTINHRMFCMSLASILENTLTVFTAISYHLCCYAVAPSAVVIVKVGPWVVSVLVQLEVAIEVGGDCSWLIHMVQFWIHQSCKPLAICRRVYLQQYICIHTDRHMSRHIDRHGSHTTHLCGAHSGSPQLLHMLVSTCSTCSPILPPPCSLPSQPQTLSLQTHADLQWLNYILTSSWW